MESKRDNRTRKDKTMPHISLQHHHLSGETYDFRRFFHQLHDLLNKAAGVKPEDCKSRVIPVNDVKVGTGPDDQDFIHLEIRLLEGRSPETKRMIGEKVLDLLMTYLGSTENPGTQMSVEIVDIARTGYFKFPPLS